jgi:hypothetical protein
MPLRIGRRRAVVTALVLMSSPLVGALAVVGVVAWPAARPQANG